MPGETIQKAVILSIKSTQHALVHGFCAMWVIATQALASLSQGPINSRNKKQKQSLKEGFYLQSILWGSFPLDPFT